VSIPDYVITGDPVMDWLLNLTMAWLVVVIPIGWLLSMLARRWW
jgi:hypothetical protein